MTDPGPAQEPRLVGILAHELRSPVAAILGYAELLVDGVLGHVDPRGREGLGRITSSARQLRALIDGMELLLGLAEPETAPSDDIDIAPILSDVAAEAEVEAALRGTPLETAIPNDLPRLRTDPTLLRRTLHLFLAAALKNPAPGPVSITILDHDVTLDILLTGVALTDDIHAASPAEITSGVGLRMALVRRALPALRATLAVDPGPPSTLRLSLPRD